MIVKIKITCRTCNSHGYFRHDHTNKCYTGLERKLICDLDSKIGTTCVDCNGAGFHIEEGELIDEPI